MVKELGEFDRPRDVVGFAGALDELDKLLVHGKFSFGNVIGCQFLIERITRHFKEERLSLDSGGSRLVSISENMMLDAWRTVLPWPPHVGMALTWVILE